MDSVCSKGKRLTLGLHYSKNTLKDFVHVGAPLGITHFIFFTSTEASTNLKIARIPRGPTLSFKVRSLRYRLVDR